MRCRRPRRPSEVYVFHDGRNAHGDEVMALAVTNSSKGPAWQSASDDAILVAGAAPWPDDLSLRFTAILRSWAARPCSSGHACPFRRCWITSREGSRRASSSRDFPTVTPEQAIAALERDALFRAGVDGGIVDGPAGDDRSGGRC